MAGRTAFAGGAPQLAPASSLMPGDSFRWRGQQIIAERVETCARLVTVTDNCGIEWSIGPDVLVEVVPITVRGGS